MPLSVNVYGFTLDSADEQAYGFYYEDPNASLLINTFPDTAGLYDTYLRRDFADMKKHGLTSVQFPTAGHYHGQRRTWPAWTTSALEAYVSGRP